MSKTTAIVSSGFANSSLLPPTFSLAVVSINPLSGKSSLCKRLIDSNIDNYRLFLLKNKSIHQQQNATWAYWGSVKHRRSDEKREALFHLIEHSTIAIDDNEQYDNYIKRITSLTLRTEEKFQNDSNYPQVKTFPKDKVTIDGFLCIHDLSSTKQISDLLFLLHSLFKTRRPILIITTKNDLIENQSDLALQFEQSIRRSSSTDTHLLSTIPIIHTSANEHVNIQAVLELALYACDEPTLLSSSSSRKASHSNTSVTKYIPPSYEDGYRNEQSLKHVIQAEYRTLLTRHVLDFRVASWIKFYTTWQHHTSIQTFIDMFGKQYAEHLYNEHMEELKRISRQKLIDERLIPIVELLVTDQKTKLSRNWDYVRLQMQKHPRYTSTVIPSSMWSDAEQNNENKSSNLIIPDDLLETPEARLCFESYINSRQLEQTRRTNCRSFFDLLNRFSDAGLVQYGHSYEKDCVYFLGRECYESLHAQDRLRVFAFHQSHLYRLICLKFVELLFESLEIFIDTFHKMNSATTTQLNSDRKITTLTIDDIFEKEIIQQIRHDSRYKALDNRETDRHRLIMCHCHFLYDCIYYPPTRNINRLIKQRKRSFKRRKSSSLSLYSHNISIDDNFCPYTRKIPAITNENEVIAKKKFEIACPMEETCADIRIMNEFFSKIPLKKIGNKNILICGNDNDMNNYLRIISNDSSLMNDLQINLWTLNNLRTQSVDGCLIVSPTGRELLQTFLTQKKFSINIDTIPMVNLISATSDHSNEIPIEQLRLSLEQLSNSKETFSNKKRSDLRILLCFMCGGNNNDIEIFFSQLASRFSLVTTNQYGDLSFIINAFLGRSNRKVEFIPISFHSLFSVKLIDFDGFILFYDRDRKAAVSTMTYLEKHISTNLQNELSKKADDNQETNGTIIPRPPIYVLCCIKDSGLLNTKKYPQSEYCVQCHSGTIRNFVESHLVPFLNQCWIAINGNITDNDYEKNENLLAGVTSYFNRTTYSSASDLMISSLERTRKQFINSNDDDRTNSLMLSSKSNEHSPKHRSSLLTPTNHEQIFSYRSFPHLSISSNGTDATIVPTTPVDPSVTNLGLLSPSSVSTSSISDNQFKKSTSMRFAKLMEHPIDGSSYQSSPSNANNENSLTIRRRINEIPPRVTSTEDMKFHLYKHRTAAHVKVPLATPEIIEFNEAVTTPLSIQQHYDRSLVLTNNNTDDIHPVNSSSSSPPTLHQQNHNSTIDESITDSSKQTRATDSSVDSSSDERLQNQRESSTTLQNINSPTNNQSQHQCVVTLQRKVSDRKSKRVRAKQNDVTGLASSTEILKKTGSDDEVLAENDKRSQQQQYPKKKRRPSFKRRKKAVYDQTQTDSGIDSRMDPKDRNNVSIAPEPSSSSNVVISNEDDSSVGDYTKDSKNTSIEELEERPTANWIRRQLQYFAQVRRDKNDPKTRSPATTITSVSSPLPILYKATTTSTPPHTTASLLSSVENSQHHIPIRLSLSRCAQSNESGVPLFMEKCIQFIEEYGLAIEGLYRVSGYKNQVELVINKLIEDPSYDLRLLQVPASAVATALKDMMRKLDEPLLSLELFDECQNLTIDQLKEQNFLPLRKAFSRTSELKYRTIKFIFKHLHFVSQYASSTHMDSSNLAVLWWPNLFQPQFPDLRTAEQKCQKTKPLIQAIIDNYPTIFSSNEIKQQNS
ncbi:unnamed protein product [Adineta steineri]|uniref:Uncharacterized protein n=1 Tax=Adineta steineri TaxID=433720 RepID=A0A819C0S6_9BILA|nr:unnamed protein product [Adineta steineri]